MSSFHLSIAYTERDKTASAREFLALSTRLCSKSLSDDGVDLVSVNAKTNGMRYQSHPLQKKKNTDIVAHDISVHIFNSTRNISESDLD